MKCLIIRKYIIELLSIVILFGCHSSPNLVTIKKEITFDVGFSHSSMGIFYDKTKSKECVYFGNTATKKCLKIFDMNGTYVDSIPLNEAIKKLDEFNIVSVVSLDTVIIGSLYTNKIIIIDRKGECWRELNLDSLITDEKGNHYETVPYSFQNDTLLLTLNWRSNSQDELQKVVPKDQLNYSKYFYQHANSSSHFAIIFDIYTKHPKIKRAGEGYYKNIISSSDDMAFFENSNFDFLNDGMYNFSCYSDFLYKINLKTWELNKKAEVKSSYTSIGMETCEINDKTIKNLQTFVTKNCNSKGFISALFYNKNDHEFYVTLFHEIKTDSLVSFNYYRPFSVIVFDSTLTRQLREYAFKEGEYMCGSAKMTREGLMMLKKNKKTDKLNNGKTTYTILNFN